MKVSIVNDGIGFCVNISFYTITGNKTYIAKPVKLEMVKVDEGSFYEPTLKISVGNAAELFKSLAEQLDKRGVKTENDFKIQGLLDATKHHLNDMRKLVFKNNPPTEKGVQ